MQVNISKYLGMVIEKNFNRKAHIHRLYRKTKKYYLFHPASKGTQPTKQHATSNAY